MVGLVLLGLGLRLQSVVINVEDIDVELKMTLLEDDCD